MDSSCTEAIQEADNVVPGPNRFCITPIYNSADTRWRFSLRYHQNGKLVEEEYSADNRVDIDTKFMTATSKVRQKKLIPCDCRCDFTRIEDHGRLL